MVLVWALQHGPPGSACFPTMTSLVLSGYSLGLSVQRCQCLSWLQCTANSSQTSFGRVSTSGARLSDLFELVERRFVQLSHVNCERDRQAAGNGNLLHTHAWTLCMTIVFSRSFHHPAQFSRSVHRFLRRFSVHHVCGPSAHSGVGIHHSCEPNHRPARVTGQLEGTCERFLGLCIAVGVKRHPLPVRVRASHASLEAFRATRCTFAVLPHCSWSCMLCTGFGAAILLQSRSTRTRSVCTRVCVCVSFGSVALLVVTLRLVYVAKTGTPMSLALRPLCLGYNIASFGYGSSISMTTDVVSSVIHSRPRLVSV